MEVAYKPRGLLAPDAGLLAGANPAAVLPFGAGVTAAAGYSAASTATGTSAAAASGLCAGLVSPPADATAGCGAYGYAAALVGALAAAAAGAGTGTAAPVRAAPAEGVGAGVVPVCSTFPFATTGGVAAGAVLGADAGVLAAAAAAPVTLLAPGPGAGARGLPVGVWGAGAGALAEDVGMPTFAPPRAWPAAAAGAGGWPQEGSGGTGAGCPVAGLTTSGQWQLKSSREQPKSCALTLCQSVLLTCHEQIQLL